MRDLQPDLSGNPFLFFAKKIKKMGTEGGNSCPSKNYNKK